MKDGQVVIWTGQAYNLREPVVCDESTKYPHGYDAKAPEVKFWPWMVIPVEGMLTPQDVMELLTRHKRVPAAWCQEKGSPTGTVVLAIPGSDGAIEKWGKAGFEGGPEIEMLRPWEKRQEEHEAAENSGRETTRRDEPSISLF